MTYQIFIRLVLSILGIPFRAVLNLIPFPKNKLIGFGSWQGIKFTDNSLYFYKYLRKKLPNYYFIIFTKDSIKLNLKNKKTIIVKPGSIKALFYSSIISLFFITHSIQEDINPFLINPKATVVNLWHGTPIKQLRKLTNNSGVNFIKKVINSFFPKNVYLVSATSNAKLIKHQANFLEIPLSKVILSGYPRNDVLQKTPSKFISNLLLYLPTYRPYKISFNSSFLEKLNQTLKDSNQYLIVKIHPADRSWGDLSIFQRIIDFNDVGLPLYKLLTLTSTLISDYSSVIFDYALLNKKIVLYLPDLKKYQQQVGLLLDPQQEIPAIFAQTEDELLSTIKLLPKFKESKSFLQKKEKFKKKFLITSSDLFSKLLIEKLHNRKIL
jgi:CDP-glycerol glycerophosphotransferase (TagB/SpsB family)